jgi:exodeoxyribonuclease VII small subunit
MKKQSISQSYSEAYQELQKIVQDMQADQVGIDTLPEKIQRANELVLFCREHLRKTAETIQQLTRNNPTS